MPLQQGERIGAYKIIAPLGQGGTATVYRAFHARLNRFVAIKMIHQDYLDNPNFHSRFEREAQIIGALEHPHIVPVYDFSEHAGEPYLVMKLIEGRTLKERIGKSRLNAQEILDVMTPVARALDYAHKQGVLHRDIKPSNIMLDQSGTPYLTDFGLARILVAGDSSASQDMMLGTPHYISPEQALGRDEVDTRSDLYSFGVVLYELLAGKVPFSGKTPYAIINDHIYEPLPLPSEMNPELSPAVEAVLLQALAKDREDRYPTATALMTALREGIESPFEPAVTEDDTQNIPTYTPNGATTPPAEPPAALQAPKPKAALPPAKTSHRKFWLVAGWITAMGAAGAMLAVLVSVFILSNRAGGASAPPATTAVALYDVPRLSHDDAQAAIAANRNDPLGYLALLRVQLDANDLRGIRRTITEGAAAVGDNARFELTAASLAVESGNPEAAFVIYASALALAEGETGYADVRASAGEAMYEIAANSSRLRPAQVVVLNAELESLDSPLVKAMVARAMLSSENLRLAQLNMVAALNGDSTLAEAHLVNGELHHANDPEAARREWEMARDAANAPQWVRERANVLLQTLI
jgi:serine/threonine-protein kinase